MGWWDVQFLFVKSWICDDRFLLQGLHHNLDGRKSSNGVFRSLLTSASSQSSLRHTRVNQDGTITSISIYITVCIHKSEANILCWTDGISRIALLELLKGIYPLCSNPFGKCFGIWFWVPKHRTSQDIIKLIGCRFATLCFGWKKTVKAAKHGTGESNSTSTMCCHVLLKISAETTGPLDETAYLLLNGSPIGGPVRNTPNYEAEFITSVEVWIDILVSSNISGVVLSDTISCNFLHRYRKGYTSHL